VRKFFLLKDRIVNLPAQLEFISLREHHGINNTISRQSVNKIFSFIFWHCQAGSIPTCKHNFISRNHANQNQAIQCLFAPFSTSVRKRGKTPKIGIIIENRKYDQ
jgi:hypothetical protein